MKTIFDQANRWLGASPLTLAANNKRPATVDDALSVAKDSGPVTVTVLANDYDPEGGILTLIGASAALGSAVAEADNTVTYTPPPGIAGFDTVVYAIVDDVGQTRDGQINVTIAEPQLSIELEPDNTMTIHAETGTVDITVTDPAEFAGSYQIDTTDLAGGPVNLVPPRIAGNVTPGQALTVLDGLWVHSIANSVPTQSWQWLRGGTVIAGETGTTYTVQTSDIGPGLSVRETRTDELGQRSAESTPVGSSFQPSDDAALLGWWDATDVATITLSGGEVSDWADKAGGSPLMQTVASRRPFTGTRTLNGGNVLDFNGAAFLSRSQSLPVSGDVAFHMALAIDTVSNAFEAVLAVDAVNDFQIDANNATQFDGRMNAAGIGTPVNLTGGPFSGAMILSVVLDRTGAGQAEVFVSNISRGVMAYPTALDASAMLSIMTNRSQNAWADGAIAEIVVTGDVGNRIDHHSYLANKWGLT